MAQEVEMLFQMSGLSVPSEGGPANMDLHLNQYKLQGFHIISYQVQGGVQFFVAG